jgi:hypothetical protein
VDKKKIALISTSVFLLLVVSASIVITVLINQSRYPDIPDPVYDITRTTNPVQSTIDLITQTPTKTPVKLEKVNCTYPSQYWIYWSDELEKLGVVVTISEVQYSPNTIAALISSVSDDEIAEFLRQLFAAHFNLQQLTDPGNILTTISEADQIFIEIVAGNLKTENQGRLPSLTSNLERFNIGAAGPGLCPGAETLIEPTATNTPLPSATPKWSNTPTASLTPSPTPTRRPTLRPHTLTPTKRPPPPPPTNPPPPTEEIIPTDAPTDSP